jgi:hypothetical protein
MFPFKSSLAGISPLSFMLLLKPQNVQSYFPRTVSEGGVTSGSGYGVNPTSDGGVTTHSLDSVACSGT